MKHQYAPVEHLSPIDNISWTFYNTFDKSHLRQFLQIIFFLILLSIEFNPCGILIILAAAGKDTCIQAKDRLSTIQ